MAKRRPLPATRKSRTHKVVISDPQSGDHSVFITVGLYPRGRPGELFLQIGKQGSTLRGFCDFTGRLTSYLLQHGVKVSELAPSFQNLAFPPAGPTSNPKIPECSSIPDYIFRWMVMEFPEAVA